MKFRSGDLVFVPCAEAAFAPGCVLSVDRDGQSAMVEVSRQEDSAVETQQVSCEDLRARFVRKGDATCQDNTSLDFMNDATILDNLSARHLQNDIYTYTASVLLAVNPYKEIDGLYSEEQCARYRGKHIGVLPPHPYAIADTAYRALVREQRNQGLLISGESGAGKTETAKIVMQFLAFASGSTSTHAEDIQARVLRAQPILESFGNAVTMRNSNSSRFGKYNRVFFDSTGRLVDASITTYLLESSRVVVHGQGERTYHCFYEMLRGLDDAKLEAMGLDRNVSYRLLCDPAGNTSSGFEGRDGANFARLCDALRIVGLNDAEIDNVLTLLAGLIHLGDAEKISAKGDAADDDDETVEANVESVEKAAKMLGMDPDELCARLTRKRVAVPGRTSFHEVPRSRSQFRHALQSLIKALYKRLFERTVQRINDSFKELRQGGERGSEQSWQHIGILDIYGFERLQRNSFEQLCINLANERLQQYFVENVLHAEQDLYNREGLPWLGLPLPDATPVFNTISQIFKTLDVYSQNLSKGVGNANDKNFNQKVVDEASKDPERKVVLKQLKMSGGNRRSVACVSLNDGFIIQHYAGPVEYNTSGWLDKNNDRLLAECEALICDSTDPLVKSLAEEDQGKALFRSISKKYSKDLESLLETLSTCNLHYIRCFKPNGEQKPDVFKGPMVLEQIVQCGTIELVKIMHDGYPNRCMFEEITTRFRDLLPENFQRYGMRTFIEALMLAYDVPRQEWALGMSRLFLKAGQLKALEGMRSEGSRPSPEKLAEIVRGIIQKRWKRAVHSISLCLWVPKFIEQIKLRRQAARRRLVGAFRLVRFSVAVWASIKSQRRARLAQTLRVAALVYKGVRPWAARAQRAVAERKEEEERRRQEELELERVELERRRMEREQQEREEEQRRREKEQQMREEKAHQELERQREELRLKEQREDQERQAFEEERRKFEEQKRQFEEDKRRSAIMAVASPQQKTRLSMPPFAESEVAVQCEDDDVHIHDSVSNVGTSVSSLPQAQIPVAVRREMEETVRRLEREMALKHEEIKAQMALLQEKNMSLAKQLEEERLGKQDGQGSHQDSGCESPGSASHLPCTPESSKRAPRASNARANMRPSLLSMDGSSRPNSTKKRHSIAHEALLRQDHPDRSYTIGEAPASPRDLGSQRKWWAEQRQFLLDDLYGS